MFVRGFAAGTVAVGTLMFGYQGYRTSVKAKSIHVEYQEPLSDKSLAGEELLKYGHPRRSPEYKVYANHALCYDQERRIPHWVAEHMTKHHFRGEANRQKSNFKSDPGLPPMFAAQNDDYLGSGWSRGHMSAAGNHKFDQVAMNDTFFLSNIVPQDMDNNAGFWNRFEIYCRDLMKTFDHVYVISGPLFMSYAEGDKKFVKYQVLGKSEVAVPTHLYKVIVAENNTKKLLGAFVVPNRPIPKDRTLKEHQVPLEYVETKTGLTMFPKLDRKAAKDLCKEEGCGLIPWDKFELYFIGRRIEGARTLHRLEKTWKELAEKRIQPDDALIALYNKKRKDLEKADNEPLRKKG